MANETETDDSGEFAKTPESTELPQGNNTASLNDDGPLEVRLYTADSSLRNPHELIKEIFSNIVTGRELAWRMFVRNIRGLYRQTVLGLFWAFLPPLAHTAIWVFLFSAKIVDFGTELTFSYTAYVLTGMVLWQSFLESVNVPLKIVKSNRTMLAKLRFPRESILMVGLYETLFNLLIRCIVLLPILIFFVLVPSFGWEGMYGAIWSWKTLCAPLGALLLVMMGMGIGLILLPFGMLYHDVEKGLVAFVSIWMLLTQIVYPPPGGPENWAASPLNWLNPASPLLLATRDVLVLGDTQHWLTAGAHALIAIPLFCAGVVIYRVSIPILVERI